MAQPIFSLGCAIFTIAWSDKSDRIQHGDTVIMQALCNHSWMI